MKHKVTVLARPRAGSAPAQEPGVLSAALALGTSLLLTGLVGAQTSSDTLIGITNAPTLPSSATVDTQIHAFGTCKAASMVGPALLNGNGDLSGGTAWDPRHEAAWISDTRNIALYRPSDKKILCQFTPTFKLTTSTVRPVVSGLAFSPSRRELYQVETVPNQMAITVYDVTTVNNCNPSVKKAGCTTNLNITGERAGGLAFDEARSLFYIVTTWSGFGGPGNTIYASPYASPCKLTTIAFNPCSRASTITGAGYSNCSKFLYLSTSTEVNVVRMDDPLNGQVTNMNQLLNLGCCQKQLGSGWAGLAVMPTWNKRSVGNSCLASSCGSCSSMQLDLGGGEAVLGNPDLAMTISGAPSSSTGAFYISGGSCTRGTSIPGLCGSVYPSLQAPFPLLLGVFPLGGTGTCGGSLNLKLGSVPTNASLCGITTCSQFLIRCPQGGLSAGLTNGLEFTIGG